MTNYTAEGKIVEVGQEESGIGRNSGKQWRKRIFVIEEQDRDQAKLPFELWNSRIDEYASLLTVWQMVRVLFNIVGTRSPQGRWFCALRAFYMAAVTPSGGTSAGPSAGPSAVASQPEQSFQTIDELRADLMNQFSVNKK